MKKIISRLLFSCLLISIATGCTQPIPTTVTTTQPFTQTENQATIKDHFLKHKDNFEVINAFLIDKLLMDNSKPMPENGYFTCFFDFSTGAITVYPSEDLNASLTQKNSVKTLADFSRLAFNCVYVSEDRIDYVFGEGSRMIIYSIDGSRPKYYFSKDDGVNFSTNALDENWFHVGIGR